jgi:hypothetical protein
MSSQFNGFFLAQKGKINKKTNTSVFRKSRDENAEYLGPGMLFFFYLVS